MQIRYLVIVLAVLVSLACNHEKHGAEMHNEESDQHDHEHGEAEKYTVYSESYELFMEASGLEADHQAEMLLHLTRLSDFKAVEKAEISVELEVNGQVVSTADAEHIKTGIYDCEPEIKGDGHGVLRIKVTENGQTEELLIGDIHLHEGHADHSHEAEEAAEVNGIVFTKEQQWKIDFATEMPHVEALGTVIKTTGKIETAPEEELVVTAKTNGFVTFKQTIANGQEVKKGQLLMNISGNELAENNSTVRFETAKNEYELAKANYDRLNALSKEKVVAEKDLLEAKSNYQIAKVTFEALETQFSGNGQNVISPRGGFIKNLLVKNGQYVEAGTPLFTVFNSNRIQITADVATKYLPNLQQIASVNLEIPGGEVYSLEELGGKVEAVGKATNTDNYKLPVTLTCNQYNGLVPGSFVSVYICTINNSEALTVPNSALLEEQGNFYLYVQVNPELFEKHQVKVGSTDGLRTEILSGISASDRVVTKGAVLVKLSKSAGALDAHSGHVH